MGIALSALAALILAKFVPFPPLTRYAPLLFVVVLILIAARFGAVVSFVGAVVGALIFAYYLYPPLGSVRVADTVPRQTISWMLLSVLAISFLLFPRTPKAH